MRPRMPRRRVGVIIPRLNPARSRWDSEWVVMLVGGRTGGEPTGTTGLDVSGEERFGVSGTPECPVHRVRLRVVGRAGRGER